MQLPTKYKPTGRTFPAEQVDNGHKRGILCLTCGIYCGKSMCMDCLFFKKCVLCGIVCKIEPTNKLYSYFSVRNNTHTRIEYYEEVKTICRILKDGLCEDCVNWESRMKNWCIMCKDIFDNCYKNFRENGNCCHECNRDLVYRVKYLDGDGNLRNTE